MHGRPYPLFLKREFTEVGDDDICTVHSEVESVIAVSNANHKPEPAGTPRFHTDEGVFENDGTSRWSLELPGRGGTELVSNARARPQIVS
jgi:hypothetical protein